MHAGIHHMVDKISGWSPIALNTLVFGITNADLKTELEIILIILTMCYTVYKIWKDIGIPFIKWIKKKFK
jgi:hypothetical protein